jgi:hypothetical protein
MPPIFAVGVVAAARLDVGKCGGPQLRDDLTHDCTMVARQEEMAFDARAKHINNVTAHRCGEFRLLWLEFGQACFQAFEQFPGQRH